MQLKKAHDEKTTSSVLHILFVFSAAVVYWHGLAGPFLFDDEPNLKALGDVGGVHDWTSLKGYILSGWSGPTGRPLSLLSFLIDDNTWPSVAASFKYTNLCLHLLCGLLLAWATYLLLCAVRFVEVRAAWIAASTGQQPVQQADRQHDAQRQRRIGQRDLQEKLHTPSLYPR